MARERRHGLRVRHGRDRALPREPLPAGTRLGGRPAHDPAACPRDRGARPPGARRERRAHHARARPRHGPDGLGQVHDARGAPRLDQPDALGAHHHDRGPRRVHPPAREVRHLAPRAGLRHADVLRRPQGGAARGPRRGPRRRAARPRDDVDGAAGRRDRPPRLRDAPHELRREGGGPPHRQLPGRGAGAGAHGPRRGPEGRRRAGAAREEGRRPRRRVRGAPRLVRALEQHPRGQDRDDQHAHPDRPQRGDDRDGPEPRGPRRRRDRGVGRGLREGARQGPVPGPPRQAHEGRRPSPAPAAPAAG